jgi:hypothetical protein
LKGIWILGEDDDPHTTIVAAKCQRAGAKVLIGSHFCEGRLGQISHPGAASEVTTPRAISPSMRCGIGSTRPPRRI